MPADEKIRVDKFLWAIRIFKTRTLATNACHTGKIKWKGKATKASHCVHLGDEYEIKTESTVRHIRVTGLLEKRVAAQLAVQYYIDCTPAAKQQSITYKASSFYTGKRASKKGRPTKKDRRDLDNLMGIE
ncbi:MAG: RNA-binding S4 domain-containing protein [Chitinophagaceae bacterium]|nr:RNA-binding S4 domain-containing protein [Chitinophagaceae bacterium]